VYVGVLLHVAFLMEPLAAELARIRPRVRVDQKVSAERAGPLEGFAALLALEHLLRRVHGPVLREADFMAEGLVAQLAGERSFAVVRPPRVHLRTN